MPGVYAVTGTLGSGKTLVTVGKIRDYLERGRRVATNLDLRLELLGLKNKFPVVHRLPDYPRASSLAALGLGNEEKDESLNGLLVLDEAGGWLNSRGWQDSDRHAVVEYMLHARKLGWDVMLIVQSVTMIDKQVRDSFVEHVVRCKRLDRFSVPFIGAFVSMAGAALRLPQVHIGNVLLGTSINSLVVDRWIYRGRHLWDAYDTRQRFSAESHLGASYLPPEKYSWLNPGRYVKRRGLKGIREALSRALLPMDAPEIVYRAFRAAEECRSLFAKPGWPVFTDWWKSRAAEVVKGHAILQHQADEAAQEIAQAA